MGLIVTSAAQSKRLTTLALVKERLGTFDDSKDYLLSPIVDEASDFICRYIGRDLALQTYKETLQGSGRTTLALSSLPVVSVLSVKHNGSAIDDFSIVDREAGFLYRSSGWTQRTILNVGVAQDPLPGYESWDWELNYVAGYVLPGSDDVAGATALPLSLRNIATQVVVHLYNVKVQNPLVKRRVVGGGRQGVEEEYFAQADLGSTGMPLGIEKSLNMWKRY